MSYSRNASRRARRAASLAGLALVAGAQLLPFGVFAAQAHAAAVTTTEDNRPYLPGMGWMENMKSNSGLADFHLPPGTFDPEGPSPESIAAAVEAERKGKDGYPADFKVVAVYSSKAIDTGMYAVRYKTNLNFGVVRGVEFDEIIIKQIDSGQTAAGGFFFVDPIWASKMPDVDPTWRTAVGGVAAVAAAAAALAAAAASGVAGGVAVAGAGAATGSGSDGSPDPNRVVGHILQLNAKKIDVTPTRPAALEASVWKVFGDGRYQQADDCEVLLDVPEGFSVGVNRAMTSISTTVSQGPKATSPAAIVVMANGPASGTTDYVQIVAEVPNTITWRLEPANTSLVPNGKAKLVLVADVALSPSAQADSSIDLEAVRDSITFTPQGDWAEVSAPARWTDGGRAVNVIARTPDPNRRLATPETIVVALAATVAGVALTASAEICCGGLPELEVIPEELEFAEGCAMAFDFGVSVKHSAGAAWTFEAAWKEGSPNLGDLKLHEPHDDRVTVRLTESAPKSPDPLRPRTVGTLAIKATADDFDDLEREIQIVSVREGLYADTLSMSPADQTFHVAADGTKKPTEIGFRVYVADPATGKIVTDPSLVKNLLIEPNDDPGTPERNAWEFAAMEPSFTGMRDTGNGPTGVYRFKTDKTIPGRSSRLELAAYVSVPGKDKDDFGYDLRLSLDTPATAPGSPQWNIEYERASKIINEFCPPKYRDKLRETLETRGKALGAEGLAEMRKRIWFISADLVLAEGAEGYEAEAAWANRIVTVLDWAQYAGDIAFGIVLSTYAGPYTAFAAQILKPMMLSAIIAYREGQTPEQWLNDQLWTVVGIFEGKLIDPDNFEKLTGGSKAKAWALYVSYHFFKEYFYNKKSFVDAIKSVGMNVAEEVLVGWLSAKVKESGVPTNPVKPEDATIRPPDTTKPADPTKPADSPGRTRPADPTKPADSGPAAARPADGTKPTDGTKPLDEAAPDQRKRPKPSDDDFDPAKEADAWVRGAGGEPAKPADASTKPTDGAEGGGTGGKREKKGPPDPTKKAPPKPKQPEISKTAQDVREATYRGPDGRRYADLDKTLEIMRDPTKVRELKNAPPDVQEAFENTRRSVYERHDARVVDAARRAIPGGYGMNVKVVEFRTPGGGSGLNTDRDFRVCYEGKDPTTGKSVWIEVPRKNWENASHQAFSDLTGGPKAADPANPTRSELEAMQHWAESHQQLATDKGHMEASLDFADQGFKVLDDGTVVKTQVTSNIELVKRGESKLIDPDGLGHMFEQKVRDATDKGHAAEGFAQARKGVEQLQGVRDGYEKQGYKVGSLPPNMQRAMDAVADAGRNSTDPARVAAAEATLRQEGYSGLGDFMGKVHSQFSSLQMARK